MDPKDFVPSLLVSGMIDSLPVVNKPLPDQKTRMDEQSTASAAMSNNITERKILQSIMSKPPAVKHFFYKPSDKMKRYKEAERR